MKWRESEEREKRESEDENEQVDEEEEEWIEVITSAPLGVDEHEEKEGAAESPANVRESGAHSDSRWHRVLE